MVYRLLYDLPANRKYDVIFMRRNLREVIKSQDVMLDRHGKNTGDMSPDKLMELFVDQLRQFDTWLAKQANFRRLDVSYNEVLLDPRPTVHALNEFLGGHLDTGAMLAVVDPELYRQRLPGS
jgi:hypothetical protein